MKRSWLWLLVMLLAGHVGAVQLSYITMRIDPVVVNDFIGTDSWFGLDTDASDGIDGHDASWPGPHPGPDAWILSYVPPDTCGDIRDGVGGYVDPTLAEVWPDIYFVLFAGEYTHGRLTWDLTQAGPYNYLLRDHDTGAEVAWLEAGGELIIDFGRGGDGGLYTLEAYVIPEPGSLLLLGSALAAVVAFRRKAN